MHLVGCISPSEQSCDELLLLNVRVMKDQWKQEIPLRASNRRNQELQSVRVPVVKIIYEGLFEFVYLSLECIVFSLSCLFLSSIKVSRVSRHMFF